MVQMRNYINNYHNIECIKCVFFNLYVLFVPKQKFFVTFFEHLLTSRDHMSVF